MIKIFTIIISLSLLIANDPYDIIKSMQDKDLSESVKATFSMKTITKKGKVKHLEFTSWTKNDTNIQKQIIWFTAPSSFRGISFLKIQKKETNNMTMWHPKYGKTRKISSQDKGNSFMNSELTYEDLYLRNVDHFDYSLIKEETINEESCYVIDSFPNKNISSNYSKHRTWISKEKLIPIKEISYDLNSVLHKEKRFYYNNESEVDSIRIKNLKKERYTILSIKSIDRKSKINDNDFTERKLKRIP